MKKSAGILLYRIVHKAPEFFLVHPGGPFWKNKDAGAWTIPKGEIDTAEDPLKAAIREFREETGIDIKGTFTALEPIRQKSGKLVWAWAVEGDPDISTLHSNTFSMEWPPRSGKFIDVPEVDKGEWFGMKEALVKILPAQIPLLEQLLEILKRS